MPSVSKPDATKFDNENDSIAESRAELHTLATSFNTIADEYNAGTLGAESLAINAGDNIDFDPDSAGDTTIHAHAPEHFFQRNTFFSSGHSGTGGSTLSRGNIVHNGINTTGSAFTQQLRFTTNVSQISIDDDLASRGPVGRTSYQNYLLVKADPTNNADITFKLQIFDTLEDSAGQPLVDQYHTFQSFTLSAGEWKFFRMIFMTDTNDTDSAGEIFATALLEDITTNAVRVRILPE